MTQEPLCFQNRNLTGKRNQILDENWRRTVNLDWVLDIAYCCNQSYENIIFSVDGILWCRTRAAFFHSWTSTPISYKFPTRPMWNYQLIVTVSFRIPPPPPKKKEINAYLQNTVLWDSLSVWSQLRIDFLVRDREEARHLWFYYSVAFGRLLFSLPSCLLWQPGITCK